MISIMEANETVKMITQENLDVRTITMGISLIDCIDSDLEKVKKKANYGSDVRQVLTWVENGDVSCGVVYATDAFTTDKVEIVCYAPEGSCKRVIYPVGIVEASKNKDAAKKFVESDESIKELLSLI